jgi:hypothetical protein
MLTPDTIRSHFDSRDIKYMQSPDGDRFSAGWNSGRHRFGTEIILIDDGEFVVFRTKDLRTVAPDHPGRARLLERLNELTFKYRVVKFVIDPSDGELMFTCEQWFREGMVSADGFGQRYHGFIRAIETGLDVALECLDEADPARKAC